ncbi:MAG: endonuclease/exonuclease/phosphatase family protein [Actinomycetota bacterium]|jgi:endonuclease/exonuclease/phosphatase family metal-dependent hydrolase
MKKTMILLMLAAGLFTSCGDVVIEDIKVMTLNIRFDNPRDSINAWPNRAAMVAVFIDDQIPDLFGMQEVLWHQYEYLRAEVPGYRSVAAGRDDGLRGGEACPVFWRLGRFDRLADGTFWLSATPDVPGSVGWGAALTRITTWVRLYDKEAKDTLVFFNTHFDHISDSARVMSSGVLLGMVKKIAGDNQFVITGDFNARPESLAIARMKEGDLAVDSYLASETPPAGVNYTFNGWKDEPGEGRIDYIFVRNGMKVMSHETHRVIEDGVFISDHWPVTAVIR